MFFLLSYRHDGEKAEVHMDELEFLKKMQELCSLKRFALKEGQALCSPDATRKRVSVTYMSAGYVAEVWMAYMVGLFSAT